MSAPMKFFVFVVSWWSDRLNTIILSELPPDGADRLWISTSQIRTTIWADWSCCRETSKGRKGFVLNWCWGRSSWGLRGPCLTWWTDSTEDRPTDLHTAAASGKVVLASCSWLTAPNELVKAGLSDWMLAVCRSQKAKPDDQRLYSDLSIYGLWTTSRSKKTDWSLWPIHKTVLWRSLSLEQYCDPSDSDLWEGSLSKCSRT